MKRPLLVTSLLLFFVSLMTANAKPHTNTELAKNNISKQIDSPAGTSTPTVCIGMPINLTADGGVAYSWKGPNNFTSEEQNPSFTATTTAMGGIYTVTITNYDSSSDIFTVSVQVRPEVLTLTASSNIPCEGSTLQLSATVSGAGLSYSWSGPNDFASTEQNPIIPNFTRDNTGDYIIKVSATNSCSNTAYVYARPNLPQAEIKVPEPTCTKNGSIMLLVSPNTPDWQVSISRSFGGTAFGVGGTKPIAYTPFGSSATASIPKGGRPRTSVFISYIFKNSNGCPTTQGALEGILDPIIGCCPSVEIYGPSATLCQGTPFTLTSEIYPFGSAYAWKGPNGFSSAMQEVNALAGSSGPYGVYTLSVTAGSCIVTNTVEVKPVFQAGVMGIPCVGGTLQLTASGMNSYSWTRPANNFSSTLQNPVIPSAKLTDAGGYLVTGRSGSCTGSAMVLVLVTSPAINPAFTVSPSNIAQGAAITLSATSATGSYSWSGPNGFSGSTRSKTINSFQAVNNGVYRLTLTSGLCKGYTEKTIVIGSVATRLANAEQEEEIAMQINAYPNPVTHTLMVEVILQKPSKLSLKLFNSIGKESGKWQLNEETLLHQTEIDMTSLTGGIYLLQAQAGKQKAVKRVVKIQD